MRPLRRLRKVVDLEAARIVVRIDVALAAAEVLRTRVVGVLEERRRAQGSVLAHVAGGLAERRG